MLRNSFRIILSRAWGNIFLFWTFCFWNSNAWWTELKYFILHSIVTWTNSWMISRWSKTIHTKWDNITPVIDATLSNTITNWFSSYCFFFRFVLIRTWSDRLILLIFFLTSNNSSQNFLASTTQRCIIVFVSSWSNIIWSLRFK